MRRYAFAAPMVMSWQLTNVKRTGRESFPCGAVNVRPMRLPLPSSSVKRYQYSVAGLSPAAMKRQVQSVSAVIGMGSAGLYLLEVLDRRATSRKRPW
jgi:hypothetical protein